MALVIEDGSVVAGADSFVEIATATTYHAARGNTDWAAATSAAQEIALRSAGDYLNRNYIWRGSKVEQTQTMCWPRVGVVDVDWFTIASNIVPAAVKAAQMELALRALSGSLTSDVSPSSYVVREKVDVLEIEYNKGRSQQTTYTTVDQLLRGLVIGNTISIELMLG